MDLWPEEKTRPRSPVFQKVFYGRPNNCKQRITYALSTNKRAEPRITLMKRTLYRFDNRVRNRISFHVATEQDNYHGKDVDVVKRTQTCLKNL